MKLALNTYVYEVARWPIEKTLQSAQRLGDQYFYNSLLEAGSKAEAWAMMLSMLLMALISVFQVLQAKIAQNPDAQSKSFDNLLDYSHASGLMIGSLKGSVDIQSAIKNLLILTSKRYS